MATVNMLLDLPVVSVTLGPLWATKLNAAITTIDEHDHTSGKGVQLTQASLNITGDLEMNSNDVSELRSTRYDNQSADLAASDDLRCLYAKGGDLYWNPNSASTHVQITSGGVLNSAALVSSLWAIKAVASNYTILSSDTEIFFAVSTAAARVLTLPAANAVTAGRYYVLVDVTGSGATNTITINRAGADTIEGGTSVVISQNYGGLILTSDGVSAWRVMRFARSASTAQEGTLKLATDLGGTSTAPTVVQLTGSSNTVSLVASNMTFASTTASPSIGHADRGSAGVGATMLVRPQAGHTNNNGGTLQLRGGSGAGTGLAGQVQLQLGTATGETMVQVLQPVAGQRVVALASTSAAGVSATELPANTGDGVVYLAAAATSPTTTANGGVLLYAEGGVLCIRGTPNPLKIVGNTGDYITFNPTVAGSAGASAGEYLQISVNGFNRKIALLGV